jgi:hypothetical protein
LALGVREFAMTSETESGTMMSVALSVGTKSMSLAVLNLAMIEIVWSMPPQAVPAILSAPITRFERVA